jgi:hypothetical protein
MTGKALVAPSQHAVCDSDDRKGKKWKEEKGDAGTKLAKR